MNEESGASRARGDVICCGGRARTGLTGIFSLRMRSRLAFVHRLGGSCRPETTQSQRHEAGSLKASLRGSDTSRLKIDMVACPSCCAGSCEACDVMPVDLHALAVLCGPAPILELSLAASSVLLNEDTVTGIVRAWDGIGARRSANKVYSRRPALWSPGARRTDRAIQVAGIVARRKPNVEQRTGHYRECRTCAPRRGLSRTSDSACRWSMKMSSVTAP
jgi:hypothetical protein